MIPTTVSSDHILPKVSVILITYNHRDYIEQALESVLKQQTDFPIEILIGDDASTDGTSDIICRYCEQYPDLIRADIRAENVGATRNAYLLLQKARGEYLASLEGDDYWTDPLKLQKQVDLLDSHPEWIGCTHQIACVDQNGEPVSRAPQWLSKKEIFTLNDFQGINLPGQASSLMRRNIFRDPQHDYSILITADPMVSDRTAALIFLLQGNFYRMPDEMSAYRHNTSADGQNLTARLFRTDERLWKDYLLTVAMEQYSAAEFHSEVDFGFFKRELFAKAVCRFLLRRSGEAGKIAKKIFSDPAVGWRGLLAFPGHCVSFFLHRI